MSNARKILGLALALLVGESSAVASPYDLPYTGRLTQTDGKPYAGTVDLEVSFWSALTGDASLGGQPLTFNDVKLSEGVFQITVTMTASNFHAIFGNGTSDVYLQIHDKTHQVTHDRQRLTAVPYALRVPVDGGTVKFDNQGRLTVDATELPPPRLAPGDTLGLGTHTATPTCTSAETGNIWFQSGMLSFCNGTTAQSVATTASGIAAGSIDTLTNKTIDADLNTIRDIDNDEIKVLAGIDATKIAGGGVTSAEFDFLGTVTSNVQTQLNTLSTGKANTAHSHGNAEIIAGIDATKIAGGGVTSAEFDFLGGITSDVQTQLTNLSAGKADAAHVHSSLDGAGGGVVNSLVVSNNGNVGLGTATPTAKLEVSGTSTATSASVAGLAITPTYNQSGSTAANTDLLINRTETSVGSGAQRLIDAKVAGLSKLFLENDGDLWVSGVVSALQFGSTTNVITPSIITGAVNGTGGSNLRIYTNSNGTVGNYASIEYFNQSVFFPALKVDNVASGYSNLQLMVDGGNVGIGSSTPGAKLDVAGDVRATGTISGEATYCGASDTGLSSTTSTTNTWASAALACTLTAKNGDLIHAFLSCNMYNSLPHYNYLRIALFSGSAAVVVQPNYIMINSFTYSGGSSTGIFRATADGSITLRPEWHVLAGTGYHNNCALTAFVIGH